MKLRPQPGPQSAFLGSRADIAIFGGSAGGGKTYALLMEQLRHIHNPDFGSVIFRRTSPQIMNEGGLWDEANRLYPLLGAVPKIGDALYQFPSGATVSFRHLQHEQTKYDWQGTQVPLLNFDEITHFSESQFFYLLSRNRSMCGVRPYVRCTCNPDADSWVANFISWWIDQQTGLAIPERSGVVRFFVRVGSSIHWGDSPAALAHFTMPDENGRDVPIPPKSVTFIAAKLTDNKALMSADPGYMANLMSLPMVERERLLHGNWKIRPAAGLYFQRAWCETVEAIPAGVQIVRGWDLAATPDTGSNDPDWTVGTKMAKDATGRFYILDVRWKRGSPHDVQEFILNTASEDGKGVAISIPQDPAQAGKWQAVDYTRRLAGYNVRTSVESRTVPGADSTPSQQSAKITRFSPFSAQAEAGNVKLLRGEWNKRLVDELEAFPEGRHKDSADATSRAFNELTTAHRPARVSTLRL